MSKIVSVIGCGLIGASIARSLKKIGWIVYVDDLDPRVSKQALDLGYCDEIGLCPESDIVFVATPIDSIIPNVLKALENTEAIVSDVGSVKGFVCDSIKNPRFVAGHPMAGNEHSGLVGSSDDLFDGSVWVLCATEITDPDAFSYVQTVVTSLGSICVSLSSEKHDVMVAQISHLPQITSTALMTLSSDNSDQNKLALRLAAGGFKDMTRISGSNPGIWPDICIANKDAILLELDALISVLSQTKSDILQEKSYELFKRFQFAHKARREAVFGFDKDVDISIVEFPVHNKSGELAMITQLATSLELNIFDLYIDHSSRTSAYFRLQINSSGVRRFIDELENLGYKPSVLK